MQRGCLKDVAAKFLPGFCLRKDGVAKCASEIAALLRVSNLEN